MILICWREYKHH